MMVEDTHHGVTLVEVVTAVEGMTSMGIAMGLTMLHFARRCASPPHAGGGDGRGDGDGEGGGGGGYSGSGYTEAMRDFVMTLAVCHTAVPEPGSSGGAVADVRYQTSSPDEGALVLAAQRMGYTFMVRVACV